MLVHGTCVTLGGKAALLLGKPGSGKSDLALRFIFTALPADMGRPQLVADDQVEVMCDGERLLARCPASISGRIEVRGVGIVAVPFVPEAELRLAVRLASREAVPRLPERSETHHIAGVALPCLTLDPFEASAPLKLAFALRDLPAP